MNKELIELKKSLRSGQQPLADWKGGRLAVSAVPGSGKSTGCAIGAAISIAREKLNQKQQLIIVTFTRSAAASIKQKIRENLKKIGYPSTGFAVHTLHGLALNIASRHPNLSGVDTERVTLVNPSQNNRLVKDTVEQWIDRYPNDYKTLINGVSFDGEETERLRRQSVLRTEVLPKLTQIAVGEAKSSGLSPERVWELSEQYTHPQDEYNILRITARLYQIYQATARSRGLIDYNDMIVGALKVLTSPVITEQLQQDIYGIIEDEAQDSNPLQVKLLETLASDINHPEKPPNLVRVGDPNQAINSTFTPADPLYFRDFCETCEKEKRCTQMDEAGRSTKIIIDVANSFLQWGNQHHPEEVPFRIQNIHPVAAGDPQPDANPVASGKGLEIYTPTDIYETVELIKNRVITLLTTNEDHNAAILVRNNRQGSFIASSFDDLQREHNINVYEVSETERSMLIPLEILTLLRFLDRPHSPEYTKATLEILTQRNLIQKQDINALATYPEQFLYPTLLDPPLPKAISNASHFCRSLLKSRVELPTYHLILFLGLALSYSGSELATLQKLSNRVHLDTQGQNSVSEMINTLSEIVNSEGFEAVQEESDNRYTQKKQVTIITMHKAKGLDWDYVFIPFLHRDNIPGQHRVPTPTKFLGDFTLSEVARSNLRQIVHSQHQQQPITLDPPLTAWEKAGQLQTAEEYRLFYVAITRAKRLLWLSAAKNAPFQWNRFNLKGGNSLQPKEPSPFFPFLEKQFS